MIAIGNLEFDIAAALLSESLFGVLAKLFDDFNGVYLAGQLREDRGLIANTGTDFENAVVGLDVQQIGTLPMAVMTRSSKALLPIVSRSANAQAAITASMCSRRGSRSSVRIGNFQSD